MAAYIVGSVCDHLVNFFHLGFRIYETAHRIWLRILSVVLEKELKVLALLNDYIIIILSPLTVFFYFCISLIKLIL